MSAEQEALARKILHHELGRVRPAGDDTVIRTLGDALGRDFLGRGGRDMFDIDGSLRVGPPSPGTPPRS
ncbi:MAG: hypothetical protein JXQ71_03595 [Verrucomicrobia bacterium]|nr:hypothetical protein [Verrucomicrobiota bacterium]